LSPSDISTGIDGEKWIIINRKKTDGRSPIPLLPQALAIVNKYKNDPEALAKGTLLPVNSNQRMNGYLKEIADIPEVYLEDTKTGKFHNLMTKDYEFTWNPDYDSETRFILHFKAVGIAENPETDDIPIYAANGNI